MSTITNLLTKETFNGNGSVFTPYPLALQRNRDEDLKVLVGGVPTSAFTISPDGLRTAVAVQPGTSVVVYRDTPKNQLVQFPLNATPAPADVAAGLNKLTLMVQEVANAANLPLSVATLVATRPPTVAWDLSLAKMATLLLDDDYTLANPTNVTPGVYQLRVTNDGNNELLFGSNFRFEGGVTPVISSGSGTDILTFLNFGGNELYLVHSINFSS